MLVKDENEWCWVIDGCVGYPEKKHRRLCK